MKRILPFLFPTVLVVDIVLVLTGVLSVGQAVVVGLVLECLVAVAAVAEIVIVVRAVRAGRAAGRTGWQAAEDGVAAVVGRRAARIILLEPKIFFALVRWIGRRPDTAGGVPFDYPRSMVMLWAILVGVVVELGVVEFLLVMLRAPAGWTLASVIVHVYAVLWFVGMIAGFAVKPHVLTADKVIVRDGIFTEVSFRYAAVADAVAKVKRSEGFGGRTGLKVTDGIATMAYDDATVRIDFRPDAAILRDGTRLETPYESLWISVGDAAAFVAAVRARSGEKEPAL